MKLTRFQLAALSGVSLFFVPPLVAQSTRAPILTVSAGYSEYDLSGVGNAPIAGARLALAVGRFLVVEPAAMYFRYQSQFGTRVTYLFPELSLQAQVPGPVRPYIGVGAGVYARVAPSWHMDLTVHGTAGFRADVDERWGFRVEGRLRSLGPFGGNVADVSFGISRALR
ncbi:MAG TPA: hypothetical protein VGA20_00850 [Gemmatimonadales bacterium]